MLHLELSLPSNHVQPNVYSHVRLGVRTAFLDLVCVTCGIALIVVPSTVLQPYLGHPATPEPMFPNCNSQGLKQSSLMIF